MLCFWIIVVWVYCLCVCVLSESYPSTQSKYACALNFGFNQWKPISDDLIGSDFQGFWTDRLHFFTVHCRKNGHSLSQPPEDEPNLGFAAALPACLLYVSDMQERYSANYLIKAVFLNYIIYISVGSQDSVTYALAVFHMCFYIIYTVTLFVYQYSHLSLVCGRPPVTDGMDTLGLKHVYEIGKEVTLACERGYTPVKAKTASITCSASGEWTKLDLVCSRKFHPIHKTSIT